MYEELKEQVCRANVELKRRGLVLYSWGNVSGIDRGAGAIIIKPSGVDYDELRADKMVVLDLDGTVIEGDLKPSSDSTTHLELYRNFEGIGGVCHTHSVNATAWAQGCRVMPCFGTTHADFFYGQVPVTEVMDKERIKTDYEANTGRAIVECFAGIDPSRMPVVLVANHGPFTWGNDAAAAVENAVVLEEVAKMAIRTVCVNPGQGGISQELLDKHYLRKHGKDAYYGQK